MIKSGWLFILIFLLSGCLAISVPTQQHPVCSWDSAVPSNADALCQRVFDTLSTVVRAEARGDNATIHRTVTNPRVVHSIIGWGAHLRRQGLTELHVVPSLTLRTMRPAYIGTGFDIFAHTRSGNVTAPQTIELHVRSDGLVIVNDQPGQDW